jgi:hypothetical protein
MNWIKKNVEKVSGMLYEKRHVQELLQDKEQYDEKMGHISREYKISTYVTPRKSNS